MAKSEKGVLTFPTKFDMVDPLLDLDHKVLEEKRRLIDKYTYLHKLINSIFLKNY